MRRLGHEWQVQERRDGWSWHVDGMCVNGGWDNLTGGLAPTKTAAQTAAVLWIDERVEDAVAFSRTYPTPRWWLRINR
jgi:hypothetical protein